MLRRHLKGYLWIELGETELFLKSLHKRAVSLLATEKPKNIA